VQDWHTDHKYKMICGLLNCAIAIDLERPLSDPVHKNGNVPETVQGRDTVAMDD